VPNEAEHSAWQRIKGSAEDAPLQSFEERRAENILPLEGALVKSVIYFIQCCERTFRGPKVKRTAKPSNKD